MISFRRSPFYTLLQWLIWPGVFCGGLIGTWFAFQSEWHLFWFNVVYLTTIAVLALFERLMPYEETWNDHDGETWNDVAHTLLNKGSVQIAAAIGTSFPMAVATVAQPSFEAPFHIWPDSWPMFFQIVLGLVIAELGLYAAHRIAHEKMVLWRFHALHHSVERLWVVNTGRFHLFDSLFKIALSQIPLYLIGAPLPVFLWAGAVTAFIGLLTHCNIDVRTGPLDYIFSTPRCIAGTIRKSSPKAIRITARTSRCGISCSAPITTRPAPRRPISASAARWPTHFSAS